MSKENELTFAVSLTVKNTADALDFYTRAFGAEELFRMPTPDGGIGHAEFQIGNDKMFISDESPEWHAYAMKDGEMASSLLVIAKENCDEAYKQAIEAGAESLNEPALQIWGVRTAMVKDPYGYRWVLRQVVEEVSNEEMMARAEKLFRGE